MPYKDRGKSHTYIYARDQFVKSLSCGYKMVTVIRLRLTTAAVGGSIGTTKEDSKHDGSNGGERQKVNSFSLVRDTILAKYAKMAKAGACQKMETPAVVVEEL